MHINPDSLTTPPSPAATPQRRLADAASRFQEALRTAVGRQEGALPESPAEMVAALRLRMLQQAIQLADDGPDAETFSPFGLLSNLAPKNPLPASQKIDLSGILTTVSLAVAAAGSADRPPVAAAPVSVSAFAESTSPAVAAGGYAKRPQNPAGSALPDIIERAAARYQVAPEVIQAVIRAESGFNPKAVSPAGAQGLMQLMPGTARELGVTDPFDPEQNVMAGTRYLKQMLGRYGGDLDKALAAYNWGPGNLDRSRDGRLPTETRRYIAQIRNSLATSG